MKSTTLQTQEYGLNKGSDNMAKNKTTQYALGTLYNQMPQEVESKSETFFYYREMLLRKVMNIFRLENVPDEWNLDYLWRNMLTGAQISIANTPVGVVPLISSAYGDNVYGFPTRVRISNHVFNKTLDLELNKDAVLLYLSYNYNGRFFGNINPLLSKYASQLSNCDSAITVNLMNSKVTMMFNCEDDLQAMDAKAVYDTISNGEPAVFKRAKTPVLNSDGSVEPYFLPVKQNYVADVIQDTKRSIMAEFWSEIGIKVSPVDKKERVNTHEVDSNDMQLACTVYDWWRNLDKQFKRVNEIFGLNIKFSMPYYEKLQNVVENPERSENDANSEFTNNDGN